MRENRQLTKAKSAKNDEFYTQYNDIQKEVNAYLDFNPDTFYKGVMGVPITFLDKYCPSQFEIVGASESEGVGFSNGLWNSESGVA